MIYDYGDYHSQSQSLPMALIIRKTELLAVCILITMLTVILLSVRIAGSGEEKTVNESIEPYSIITREGLYTDLRLVLTRWCDT